MVTYSTVYVEFTFLYLKVRVNDEKQGVRQDGDCWVVVSDHDDWPQQCTLYYMVLFFCEFFFRNLTTMLVLIEEPLLYLQPCCLANSPFRVPGQDSNPGLFGRQACYQPTNDDLCFGFFVMFLCLICKEAGACSSYISPPILDIFGSQFFFVSLFSCF